MQVIPSGPGENPKVIYEILTTLIYSASEELTITTPYLIPDETLAMALTTAAHRGVKVTLVVPMKVDSILVRHASRSHFHSLLDAGVHIAAFKGGLLHSKTITIDGKISFIGTVNMDMRSFLLNLEVTLIIYDELFTQELKDLQATYLTDSDYLLLETWRNRPRWKLFIDNCFRLFSPLL